MSSKKPYNNENDNHFLAVSESTSQYGISFTHSFSEMNELDAKTLASTSPEQHLKNTTALVKETYKEVLAMIMTKKIGFK
jgi:hypothetical protein